MREREREKNKKKEQEKRRGRGGEGDPFYFQRGKKRGLFLAFLECKTTMQIAVHNEEMHIVLF